MNGTLYIVATPIGHLDDMTHRAVETLRGVDIVLCEDTRVTKKLLAAYAIETRTMSYHQHSPEKQITKIRSLLVDGNTLALVTDAGTPGISDPGNQLIHQILETNDIAVVPIPGACAVTAALSVSGFPTDKFLFLGFPPHKKKRKKYFEEVAASPFTTAFYESCHRIKKCLGELAELLEEDREVCVCRELTKKFESIYRGTIAEIGQMDIPDKGEFVVIVRGKK